MVGYIPGLIRGLISEITLCFSVNDMEVTGALQERTHTVDRNTNRSTVSHPSPRSSRPTGFPPSELRGSAWIEPHRPV